MSLKFPPKRRPLRWSPALLELPAHREPKQSGLRLAPFQTGRRDQRPLTRFTRRTKGPDQMLGLPELERAGAAKFTEGTLTGHGLQLLINQAQRAVDLLQEPRTALISASVTGRIDVRNTKS